MKEKEWWDIEFNYKHSCEFCEDRVDGIWVKVCRKTGKPIQDHQTQYNNIVEYLKANRHMKHRPGIDEH